MGKCRFDIIILIGQGVIARNVLKTINDYKVLYGYEIQCIIHENIENNLLYKECNRTNTPYICIEDSNKITECLLSNEKNNALIISCFNNYLFPKCVIDINKFTIINYHNSFLPEYQGGNAITWAIFNKEKKTGATWHYVERKVDTGDIIWQKEFDIKLDAKAYEVSRDSMNIAYEGFNYFFPKLLLNSVKGKKQIYKNGKRDMRLFSDVPMNGEFSLDCPCETIYRLLRSMDYGKTSGWRCVKVVISGDKKMEVVAYRLIGGLMPTITNDYNNTIYFDYDGKSYLKICVR